MNQNCHNEYYAVFKPIRGGTPSFIGVAHTDTIEVFRNRHQNQGLLVSMCLYAACHRSAVRIRPLYFVITAPVVETARASALQAGRYIAEEFRIPEEDLDIVYDGGGKVGNIAAGDNDDFAEKAGDTADTGGQAPQLCDQDAAGAAAGDNYDIGGNASNAITTDAPRDYNPAASSSSKNRGRM